MRKILKFIFSLIPIIFFGLNTAYALENDSILTTKYIDNVWSFHYRNGKVFTYGQLPFRYQNGQMAYCIDPPTPINSNVYSSSTDWGQSGYTEEEKYQMELIAHYGYGYEGHDSIEYYMATQELIWLFSADEYIKWTKENHSDSEEINIEKEKNEILNLVNKHNVLPSFINGCYTQNYGTKLSITDKNNVLNNYEIKTDLNYKINDSVITFDLNKFGTHKIQFVQKRKNNLNTTLYKNNDIRSQVMAVFGFNDIKEGSITIVSEKIPVRINKRDSNTRNLIKSDDAIFKIKDLDNNKYVEEIKTDKNGYAMVYLKKGKYQIEEIKAPDGYVVNNENKIIELNDSIKVTNNIYDVDIFNNIPKGRIKILKVNEEDEMLDGVEIGLYDKNYKLLKTLTTAKDNNYFDELELGTYYIKEINTIEGYELDEKYHKIDIKYIDDKTNVIEKELKIVNEKIKCDIVYISSSNDKPLKDVTINVYNDINEIVYTGKTNKDGKITIEDLPYGRYYIKQISVPSGYILNTDKISFQVSDSSCLKDIKVLNEKSVMPVTTSSNSNYQNILAYILIGVILIVKKIK